MMQWNLWYGSLHKFQLNIPSYQWQHPEPSSTKPAHFGHSKSGRIWHSWPGARTSPKLLHTLRTQQQKVIMIMGRNLNKLIIKTKIHTDAQSSPRFVFFFITNAKMRILSDDYAKVDFDFGHVHIVWWLSLCQIGEKKHRALLLVYHYEWM